MDYFVTAIGTNCGKTVVSSILVEALKADYWKPIQSGLPRDTETVASLVTNHESFYHPEGYLLNTPISPHASAKIDGIEIELNKLKRPDTNNNLIIEGAGGMMVPINDQDYVIDIAPMLNCEIILVVNLYLGSINHTLLSLEYLRNKSANVKGIMINGLDNPETIRIIEVKSKWPILMKIDRETNVSQSMVKKYANRLEKI